MGESIQTGYAKVLSRRDQVGCYAADEAINILEDGEDPTPLPAEGVRARLDALQNWIAKALLKTMIAVSSKKRELFEEAFQENADLGDFLIHFQRDFAVAAATGECEVAGSCLPRIIFEEGYPGHFDTEDFMTHMEQATPKPQLGRRLQAIQAFRDAVLAERHKLAELLGIEFVEAQAPHIAAAGQSRTERKNS